jgi:ketosteroid isomerase-like protein
MRKAMVVLLCGIVVLLVAVSVSSRPTPSSSYAEDRAEIEDLQARYMFALDFKDPDTYASTFTPDGVLDYGPVVKGRDAIKKVIADMGKRTAVQPTPGVAGQPPVVGRHNISNIVIKIDGDKAEGRAYWFHYSNRGPKGAGTLDSFGHYEDEMVKVDGRWYFSKRKIYNEQVAAWAYKGGNPAW